MNNRWYEALSVMMALAILSAIAAGAPVRAEGKSRLARTTEVQLAADRNKTGLHRIRSLNSTGIRALKKVGITSLAKLSRVKTARLADLLKVDKNVAGSILKDANKELQQLKGFYRSTRSRLGTSAGQGGGDSNYANLIAPTNECTILVRQVCGPENQCADRGGCGAAMSLLENFNSPSVDQEEVAEACVVALTDSVVFPWCTW